VESASDEHLRLVKVLLRDGSDIGVGASNVGESSKEIFEGRFGDSGSRSWSWSQRHRNGWSLRRCKMWCPARWRRFTTKGAIAELMALVMAARIVAPAEAPLGFAFDVVVDLAVGARDGNRVGLFHSEVLGMDDSLLSRSKVRPVELTRSDRSRM
jgi:hypothetical protein